MHSESTEDHLERIADLVANKGYARVTDVAEALGLTTSAVSNMVRRLAARGFVNYERYRGFSLTSEGRAVAARIQARHDILSELLGQLGLGADTIEAEVEEIARIEVGVRGTGAPVRPVAIDADQPHDSSGQGSVGHEAQSIEPGDFAAPIGVRRRGRPPRARVDEGTAGEE